MFLWAKIEKMYLFTVENQLSKKCIEIYKLNESQ